jgi:membrane associated rhomboid family serine protease
VIPIADSVRSRGFPYVNVAIIVTCLLVFMYEVVLSQDVIRGNITELDRFIFRWGNVPGCTFDALGGNVALSPTGQALCDEQPRPVLTVFTAMFMHGSWLHVLGNMLFLWIFGDNVEEAMGHGRYAVFYVLAGVLASLVQGLTDASALTPAIGASGAIAGVMGAYIVLFPRATVAVIIGFIFIPVPLPAWVLIGFWFVSQAFYGISSLGVDAVGAGGGVAYFAHIGGFVAGAALVRLFVLGRARMRQKRAG